ncbi:MAG: branched-chain amino acid ABC transporter permease [Vulcanimicrobiaceae bacterium]
MLEQLVPELVNGLALGALFAMIAIGLSLIMNLTGTINLAHGSFMTLAGYLAYTITSRGGNFWLALIVGAIATMVVGIVVERLLIARLYARIPLYSLLLTFGLALIFEELFRLIWGLNGVPFSPPAALQGAAGIGGGLEVSSFRLVIAGALIVVLGLLLLFLYRTPLGLRLRGAVLDPEMMQAFGTNTQLLYMTNFAVGILLAAIAGVFTAGIYNLEPTMGNQVLMPAFITVVIGGLGSITGSVVGGLLIGVAISVTTLYVPAASEVVMYVLMALVLTVRPRGLFGVEGLFG